MARLVLKMIVQQRISSSGEHSLVRKELFYLTYYLNPVNLRFAKFLLLSGVSNDLYLSPWLLAWWAGYHRQSVHELRNWWCFSLLSFAVQGWERSRLLRFSESCRYDRARSRIFTGWCKSSFRFSWLLGARWQCTRLAICESSPI